MNLTRNLTKKQQERFTKFVDMCFPFRMNSEVMWTTVALGHALDCRPDNVEKTLLRISRRLGGRLRIQRARPDSRNRPIPLESDEIKASRKGGRKKRTYKTEGHPVEGNSIWLHVYMTK